MSQLNIPQVLQRAVQCQLTGRLDEAQALCEQVLAQVPNHPAALHLLGTIAGHKGNHALAVSLLRQAVALDSKNPGAHTSLGFALAGMQQFNEAIGCYQRAIAIDPNYAKAHCNLGVALARQGRMSEAVESLTKSVALNPNYPAALCNLGAAQTELGALDSAVNHLRRALTLNPKYATAHLNLGSALLAAKKYDLAIASLRRALELNPNDAKSHSNLAAALMQTGQLEQSLAEFRTALKLKPDDAQTHSALIFAMHYDAACGMNEIAAELENWNRRHALPLAASIRPHENDRSPDRRLRIGYVSPNLCRHSVARFLLPILKAHDRERFEIFCYASVVKPDDMTQRLQAAGVELWRDVRGLPDEELANQIREDRIDILVDLALHTGENLLLAFARKPAPVQVTYLAYCGSSGMRLTMDYRLTDPYFDPPERDDSAYAERSVRLPQTYWCYEPTGDEPSEVNALPAATNGFVTFGCLNSFAKVSKPTLDAWASLMQSVGNSRLILHVPAGAGREPLKRYFAERAIDSNRLTLVDTLPSPKYFETYQKIDIALDPFPFGGGTTSCDALWMGVPLVSWAGEMPLSRAGLSIVANVGVPELVGNSVDKYVEIAAKLARDVPRLVDLRRTLRERMRRSPLMDAARFTRHLESAYRTVWREWCEKG